MPGGLTGPNLSGVAVFVLLPFFVWGLAVGTTRFNSSQMARTRAAFPGLLVLPAGWAWFMVPPLRSRPYKPIKNAGYIRFLLAAHEQHLTVYRTRFRKGYVLAGQLACNRVRSIGDIPSNQHRVASLGRRCSSSSWTRREAIFRIALSCTFARKTPRFWLLLNSRKRKAGSRACGAPHEDESHQNR